MEKQSKILVTGANGLVGSALVEHLTGSGYSNVIPFGRDECDLMDACSTNAKFLEIRPDFIFHCAARVYGIMGNMLNKGVSFFENAIININVIEAARLSKVRKITAMGTGAVYPFPPKNLPLRENDIFDGRPHPSEDSYAQAKRAMLAMLCAYQESYGLDWAFVASCNLFGPRDKFDTVNGHVVPSLIEKFYEAKKNKSNVIVWGDGSARRDFMYVKDVAVALEKIMLESSGSVNLGSGDVKSIKEIVENLESITGLSNKVIWDHEKPNGQDYRAYDLSKLSATGFACRYNISSGLRETWDWYVNERDSGQI